jgi:hypothetical protein
MRTGGSADGRHFQPALAALPSGPAQRQKLSAQEFPPDNLAPGMETRFCCAGLHESADTLNEPVGP